MTREFKATRGARQRMESTAVVGGFALRATQLIREQTLPMGQYLVTMMPPTRGDGVVPYVTTYDGTAVYPAPAPLINTAPILPDPAAALQVAVSWGAGGVRYQTAFDYPVVGGTFSITCDAMDVNVSVKGGQVIAYNDVNLIPVVGAFYVLGAPVDDTPMAWLEPVIAVPAGGVANFAVKPFAKELAFSANIAVSVRVSFMNAAGTLLWDRLYTKVAGTTDIADTVQVPRQAAVVAITAAAGTAIFLEWGIGLS